MEPFIQVFSFEDDAPDGSKGPWEITSVVVDACDFDSALEVLFNLNVFCVANGQRFTREQLNHVRASGNIPLISRGSKTEPVFAKFGVKTKFMGLIVRGAAARYLAEHFPKELLN